MKRREFLGASAALMLAGVAKTGEAAKLKPAPVKKLPTEPRNRVPYTDLNWKKVEQIRTTSHGHCIEQWMMDAYIRHGFGLLTLSNYYPSGPWCPAAKMTKNYYRTHHTTPVTVNGKFTPGPFDWSRIAAKWKDEIDPKYREQLPFRDDGEKVFTNVPKGILEAPNAEHHFFYDDNGYPAGNGMLHMCAPGSAYVSGTFDEHNRFKTHSHGYCFGSGEHWKTAIDRMIAGLIVPDGGGVTINHPTWSSLRQDFIMELLNYDPRVLGLEVLENGRNSEAYWDYVLGKGVQCFGFFVPDWGLNRDDFGANVLLVEEHTVEACLRAYRKGNWYGSLKAMGDLAITEIGFANGVYSATTDKPARWQAITKSGIVREVKKATKFEYAIPKDQFGSHVYIRLKAFALDGSGEVLFSQPVILT